MPQTSYPSSVSQYYQHQKVPQVPFVQFQNHMSHITAYHQHKSKSGKQASRSPTPPPISEFPCHWDYALKSFLTRLGLMQTLRGFESDMLIMNEEWERSMAPAAVEDLVKDLSVNLRFCILSLPNERTQRVYYTQRLGKRDEQNQNNECSEFKERPLDDRKLDYIHFSNGIKPLSPTSVSCPSYRL
jgi:hypothetical protein